MPYILIARDYAILRVERDHPSRALENEERRAVSPTHPSGPVDPKAPREYGDIEYPRRVVRNCLPSRYPPPPPRVPGVKENTNDFYPSRTKLPFATLTFPFAASGARVDQRAERYGLRVHGARGRALREYGCAIWIRLRASSCTVDGTMS